jgi:FkbM family methyltransferase
MTDESFSDDYNLSKLAKIETYGLNFFTTPRFKEVYKGSDYEALSIRIFSNLIKKGDTIIDIGAHHGIYSLIAGTRVGVEGKVFSFEPSPVNNQILQKNVAANRLTDMVSVSAEAVSNKRGRSKFIITEASDNCGFSVNPNTEAIKTITIAVNSLDYAFKDKRIDFIKMDAEGHEIEILEGSNQVLHKNKNIKLLIEFNPKCLRAAGHNPLELLELLRTKYDFDLFFIDDTTNKVSKSEPIQTTIDKIGDKYANLLCVPRALNRKLIVLYSHLADIKGGGEHSLFDIGQYLAEQDHLVHYIFPKKGDFSKKVSSFATCEIIESAWWASPVKDATDYLARFQKTQLCDAETVAKLTESLEFLSPDVVLTNTSVIPWMAVAAKVLGIPHCWFIREFGEGEHGIDYVLSKKDRYKFIEDYSVCAFANSDALAKEIRHYSKIPVHVTYPNFNSFPVNSKVNVPNRKMPTELLIFGAVSPHKGHVDAVKVLGKLVAEGHTHFRLSILGPHYDKAYLAQLKKLVAHYKLARYVKFIQHTNNPIPFIDKAHLVLVCSRDESLGRVAIEAMLRSRVVISTPAGGLTEIIKDGHTGLLYQPGDIDGLKQAILTASSSPESYKRLAESSFDFALKKFVLSNSNATLESLLVNYSEKKSYKDPILSNLVGNVLNIGALEKLVQENGKQILALQSQVQNLEKELGSIYNSRAWKAVQHYRKVAIRIKNPKL